jgi:hypothetical protein
VVQAKDRSTTHRLGQQDKAAFGLRQLDDFETDTVLRCRLCGYLTGIALINEGHIDGLGGDVLDCLGQVGDLGAVALGGRGDMQRQQVAEGVDDRIHLRALPPLGAVPVGVMAALGR